MKKILVAATVFLVALILPLTALAAEFRVPSEKNGNADVGKNETPKNLYIAGNIVNVAGNTQGDLLAAGNSLNLTGEVENSLFAAGNTVNVEGKVGKTARLGGSNVTVSSSVGGDLFAAATNLNLASGSQVGGDLYAGAAAVSLNGEVVGLTRIAGGEVTVNGKIDGDLVVDATSVTIGDGAVINGKFSYKSPKEAVISSSAKILGPTDYQKTENKISPRLVNFRQYPWRFRFSGPHFHLGTAFGDCLLTAENQS